MRCALLSSPRSRVGLVRSRSVPWQAVGAACLAAACGAPLAGVAEPCQTGAGDLLITEIMANPPGTDGGQEWFEIYNASGGPVSLQGILLEKKRADGTALKLWPIGSAYEILRADYFVLGDMPDDQRPDYVDLGYDGGLGALPNSDGSLALRCATQAIDEVTYAQVPVGASWSLDIDAFDADANDSMSAWCRSLPGPILDGTPGEPNPPCSGGSRPLTCLSGDERRDIVVPASGDLLISELQANPSAVSDETGEYVELYATQSVDLNGVELSHGSTGQADFVFEAVECLSVSAGQYVVLAAASDDNGGVHADYPLDFRLPNAAGTLTLSAGGEPIDQVAYGPAKEGVSYGRDPGHLDATASDDSASWCYSTSSYGDGDLGTPGESNDPCQAAAPSEACRDGETTRVPVVPERGDLVITELMNDPAAVSDSVGEWFEACATRDIDLNGLEIGKEGVVADRLVQERCLGVGSGECVVFGRSLDPEANGGVPVDILTTASLVNGAGDLYLTYEGNVLDEVSWTTSREGVAASYSAAAMDPSANDSVDDWCPAAAAWEGSAGDWGSPGVSNSECAAATVGETCLDGSELRPIELPGAGSVVVTELMPNPVGTDSTNEWIELFAFSGFDLAALTIGEDAESARPVENPQAPEECLRVAAGSYVVVARTIDAAVAGDVACGQMSLNNTTEDAVWVGADGVMLDAFSWSGTSEGQSICRLAPTGADWGVDPSGGTPGAENGTCVVP